MVARLLRIVGMEERKGSKDKKYYVMHMPSSLSQSPEATWKTVMCSDKSKFKILFRKHG